MIKRPPEPKARKARGNRSAAQVPPPLPPKKSKPPATTNRHTIASLADRLTALANDYKDDVASVIEDAEKADIDPGALRRLVAWQRQDAVKRAERAALDEQYRFLAGELAEPAELPTEGELVQAVRFYGDGLSVRQVADVLKISVGKAHKLKTQAAAFSVHSEMNVNTPHTEINPASGAAGIAKPVRQAAPALGDETQRPMTEANAVPEETKQPPQAAPPADDSHTSTKAERQESVAVPEIQDAAPAGDSPRLTTPRLAPDGGVGAGTHEETTAPPQSMGAERNREPVPTPIDTRTPAEIAGSIPDFLDQRTPPLTSN